MLMPRSLLIFSVAGLVGGPCPAADPKVEILDVHSVTVPSGKHAGADGFVIRAEPREGEKEGKTVTVPDLRRVRVTIGGKPATRAEVIEWVADQRFPRVEVTTESGKNDSPVELRFYPCPPSSRKNPGGG